MSERQTVAGAYAKIEGHEDLCAERYRNIDNTLAGFKVTLESSHRRAGRIELAAWSLLVGLVMMLGGVVIKLGVGA